MVSGCAEKERRKYGVGVQYMKFSPVVNAEEAELADETKHFWIANIHYPLGFKDKMIVNKYLKNRVVTLYDNAPVIICGDFNTFMDDGGAEQLEDLQTVFKNQSTKIEYTFTTFPHDSYCVKTGKIMSSKLDHVFTYPQTFDVNVTCLSTLESRISDHYAMIIDF
jgi:endonuclease/exonuclease/phosphatase family metal-dependent hydrolase